MKNDIDYNLVKAIENFAAPLVGALQDYDPIIKAAKNKTFVMIGEASHGTKEFYHARAEITQRLIQEMNFDAVAVEADWPDAYRVNRYVSLMTKETASQSLSDFERFPSWMWRNREVAHFIAWLKNYNLDSSHQHPKTRWPVGFFGLDLYSMGASIRAVISYLDKIDPVAAKRARLRYACLDHFIDNPQAYGYAVEFERADSCERHIIDQLVELRRKAYDYIKKDGLIAEDEYLCARQNAKIVANAEGYYRALYRGRPNTWNLRDRHMFETLEDLAEHLGARMGREPRIIVWAHNFHIGNAAATEMNERGEFNIGQLVRSAYKDKSLLIGFSTCRGTVTAADNWDEPHKNKRVREPFPGSYEEVFHHVNQKAFLLDLRDDNEAVDGLMTPRLQRAIGVIYRPDTERHSHYFHVCLPEQFDFMLHYDDTHAVEPLAAVIPLHHKEMDETYPSGL